MHQRGLSPQARCVFYFANAQQGDGANLQIRKLGIHPGKEQEKKNLRFPSKELREQGHQ